MNTKMLRTYQDVFCARCRGSLEIEKSYVVSRGDSVSQISRVKPCPKCSVLHEPPIRQYTAVCATCGHALNIWSVLCAPVAADDSCNHEQIRLVAEPCEECLKREFRAAEILEGSKAKIALKERLKKFFMDDISS